jgi:hypothetical protein
LGGRVASLAPSRLPDAAGDRMSMKRKLAIIAMCLPLALGAMAGGPMPPEEIEKLLHASHQQEIAYVLENRKKEGETDEEDDLSCGPVAKQ